MDWLLHINTAKNSKICQINFTIIFILLLSVPNFVLANNNDVNQSNLIDIISQKRHSDRSNFNQPHIEDIQLREFASDIQPIQMIDIKESSRLLGYGENQYRLEKQQRETSKILEYDNIDALDDILSIKLEENNNGKKNLIIANSYGTQNSTKPKELTKKYIDQLNIAISTNQPIVMNAKTSAQLLSNARQHSHKINNRKSKPNLPAFNTLIKEGIQHIKNNRLNMATDKLTKAQRINPHSSAVYFYLGQISLNKKQAINAEAFARRGLLASNNKVRKKLLWKLILDSAEIQGDKKTITEAKKALQ